MFTLTRVAPVEGERVYLSDVSVAGPSELHLLAGACRPGLGRHAPRRPGRLLRSPGAHHAPSRSSWLDAPPSSRPPTAPPPGPFPPTPASSHPVTDPSWGVRDAVSEVDVSVPSLAELLSGHGFATYARINHVFVSNKYGFDRGFDRMQLAQNAPASESVDDLLGALNRLTERGFPVFSFLHLFDPHWNYEPSEPWLSWLAPGLEGAGAIARLDPYLKGGVPLPDETRREITALYDGEVAAVDHALGRLLLDQRPRLIAVTSDHGRSSAITARSATASASIRSSSTFPSSSMRPVWPRACARSRSLCWMSRPPSPRLEGPGEPRVAGRRPRPHRPRSARPRRDPSVRGRPNHGPSWRPEDPDRLHHRSPTILEHDLERDPTEHLSGTTALEPYANWLHHAFLPGLHAIGGPPSVEGVAEGSGRDPRWVIASSSAESPWTRGRRRGSAAGPPREGRSRGCTEYSRRER